MANNDILSRISQKDIKIFNKDFSQLLRVASEMDRYYAEWQKDIDKYFKKFGSFVKLFNKKYSNIKVKISRKIDAVEVRILVNEKSLNDLFGNSASRIMGLKTIGTKNFGAADVAEAEKFASEVNKIKDKLFLTYYQPDIGMSSVFLSKKPNEKMVELHWDVKESINEASPDFKLCAYYALKDGYNKDVKIFDEGGTFGFSSLFSERQKGEYADRFNPRVLE